jgi:hypothetical protein
MPGIADVRVNGFANPLYTGMIGGGATVGGGTCSSSGKHETFSQRSMHDATFADADASHYAEVGPIATDGRSSLHNNPTYTTLPTNGGTDEAPFNQQNYAASNRMYSAITGGSSGGGERAALCKSRQHVVHDVGGRRSERGDEEGLYVEMDPDDRVDDTNEELISESPTMPPTSSVDNPIYHIMNGTVSGETTDV